MSAPYFQLSKRGAVWWATFPIGQKTVKVECGDGSRKAAEKRAGEQLKRRLQLYNAAKQRWVNAGVVPGTPTAPKRRQSAAGRPGAPAAPPPDELEGDLEVTPIERPPAPAPPPPPRPDPPADLPAAAAPDPNRAAEIKAKLLALGDGRPIEPDAVHGPGERPGADDEPADDEATELLADLFASMLILGHHKLVEKWLARWKPPKRPGEPHEKMADWEQEGLSHGLRKILGDRTSMSPFMKWAVGTVGATATMLIGAERIDVAPAAAAPAPPAAAAAPPATSAVATADDVDDAPTPIRPAGQTNALGRFK